MGLDQVDLRFDVTRAAFDKGFFARTDTFLWGILSHQCADQDKDSGTHGQATHAAPRLSDEVCRVRSRIAALTGWMYVLLSFGSMATAMTIGLLVLAASPLVQLKRTITAYACSITLMLVPLLIFEILLMWQWEQPDTWGIYDHKIHTSLAGVDHHERIPRGITYSKKAGRISRILVWFACISMIVSFVCFIIRAIRARERKEYLHPVHNFMRHRHSIQLNEQPVAAGQSSSSL